MDNRQHYIMAALGDEAERFFETELGQYVIGRSLQEVADQQRRFEEASNDDTKLMQEVHFKQSVARLAVKWLNEAIHSGRQSLAILEDESGQ